MKELEDQKELLNNVIATTTSQIVALPKDSLARLPLLRTLVDLQGKLLNVQEDINSFYLGRLSDDQ